MNTRNVLLASALLILAGLATTACAAPEVDVDGLAQREDTASTATALRNTGHAGGGSSLYGCSGMLCTCTGDADCTDMFTNAGCGDVTHCDNSGPEAVCWCLKGLRTQGDAGTKLPRATHLATSAEDRFSP
jgi:hypothetical protein